MRVPSPISRLDERFACNGDVDAARDSPWGYATAFAAYYSNFHRRDLEAARRAPELLKFRNLDEKPR